MLTFLTSLAILMHFNFQPLSIPCHEKAKLAPPQKHFECRLKNKNQLFETFSDIIFSDREIVF